MNKKSSDNKFCDVCNIHMQAQSWPTHLTGKRHIQTLSKQKTVVNLSLKTVFVKGFAKGTTKPQLTAYFQRFGPVSEVVLDKNNALFAFVMFTDPDTAKLVLTQKHKFNGHYLYVRAKRPFANKPFINIDSGEKSVLQAKFLAVQGGMLQCQGVEEQILYLVQFLKMSAEDEKKRLSICEMLQNVFIQFLPQCHVIPFGSCVNGLGTLGCDLDIFVDLGFSIVNEPMEEQDLRKSVNSICNTLDDYRGCNVELFRALISELPPKFVTQVLAKIISQYAPRCRKISAITAVRCPIVNFVHQENISCDLSFTSSLGVHNSVLIRFCQQLDPRVHPLMFIIRYWAKQRDLCDSKKRRLSSYAVTMLVIFYLQNRSPPILPSIDTLMSLSDAPAPKSDWNCNFCMDISRLQKSLNTECLERLFEGFFEFYAKLNILEHVLCLNTGKAVKKDVFAEEIQQDSKLSEFKLRFLNVQDPFELNFNITGNVEESGAVQWTTDIEQTFRMVNSETWHKSNESWGLATIFKKEVGSGNLENESEIAIIKEVITSGNPLKEPKKQPEILSRMPTTSKNPSLPDPSYLNFTVSLIANNKAEILCGCHSSCIEGPVQHYESCLQKTYGLIRGIFEKCLKFHCTEVEAGFDLLELPEEVIDKKTSVTHTGRFHCKAFYKTWVNRKKARQALLLKVQTPSSFLDIEELTSNFIIDQENAPNKPEKPIFHFYCIVQSNKLISASLHLLLLSGHQNDFKGPFFQFITSYVKKFTNLAIMEASVGKIQ